MPLTLQLMLEVAIDAIETAIDAIKAWGDLQEASPWASQRALW